jgi:subtilisin-like proprotein convertase family protein
MARSMGEGWSDFYAAALLSEPADNALGVYPIGSYSVHQVNGFSSEYFYGIRRFPLALKAAVGANNLPFNPLTFRYLNSNCDTLIGTTATNPNSAFPRNPVFSTSSGSQPCDQVLNAGEIWSTALWEVRGQLIAQYGPSEGNRRALQYITDGMKLAPLNPTMLQERDAIISAAVVNDPNDAAAVRHGFALRGMGLSASIQNTGTGSNTTVVTEAYDETPNVTIAPGFAVSDAPGDNDGYPEQGESLFLMVPLVNNTGAPISNVSVHVAGGGSANYGTINNGQTVTQNIAFTVPIDAPCPGELTLTFTISSSAGSKVETRSIMIGIPVGGPPVTFTNATPLTIPDSGASAPYGTTITASGLTGGKKIKLELTGLTHSFPGDLDILLVGPGGQKFIVMSDVGGSTGQTNANVALKDGAANLLPVTASGDLTGEWKPTNSLSGDIFPPPAPGSPYSEAAPAGAATFTSVFGVDGAAMNGTWTLYVVDDTSGDSGSLAGWRLTFEPALYTCFICRLCPSPHSKCDFDGDGRTDLSVFRPSEGNWYLNRSTSGFVVANWGLASDLTTPGDFDGDGKTDLAVWRPSSGTWYVLQSLGNTAAIFNFGSAGDIPVQADFDGDNRGDFAVFRPSTNVWYIQKSGGGTTITAFGASGDVPVRGDFDGDGKADIAVFRPSTGQWWIAKSNGGVSVTTFGLAGDQLVPADYDGDFKTDIAVYRGGTWYILRSTNGAVDIVNFGLADDVPVPGDYDGDQKDDQAIYRNGTWWLNRSTAGVVSAPFGVSDDLPLPSRYLP